MPAEATPQNVEQNQPQSGQQPAATPQASGQPTGQQTPPQSSTQRPDAAQNSGNDDARVRGIIADLQKERNQRQQFERQIAELTGRLDTEQRRIRALAGVDTPSAEEQELEQVRARVIQLFPALGKLTEEKLDQILGLSERANGLEEVTQHHWQRHGQTMLDGLRDEVAEATGLELTPRQTQALQRAYVAECESNPEFLDRHTRGDKTLITEFAKQWVEDWFEPARKTIVSQEASRFRRVPSGRDRNVQTTPPKKIDFKDGKATEDAMVEAFKQHGGRFQE